MDDLISRVAAIEAALDGADEWDGGCNPTREEYIREHMAKIPAVDAVPVVRCKDCQYYNDLSDMGKTSYCELHHYEAISGEIYGIHTKPDDYCSWAEKEEC